MVNCWSKPFWILRQLIFFRPIRIAGTKKTHWICKYFQKKALAMLTSPTSFFCHSDSPLSPLVSFQKCPSAAPLHRPNQTPHPFLRCMKGGIQFRGPHEILTRQASWVWHHGIFPYLSLERWVVVGLGMRVCCLKSFPPFLVVTVAKGDVTCHEPTNHWISLK